jgi:hypothetical protein
MFFLMSKFGGMKTVAAHIQLNGKCVAVFVFFECLFCCSSLSKGSEQTVVCFSGHGDSEDATKCSPGDWRGSEDTLLQIGVPVPLAEPKQLASGTGSSGGKLMYLVEALCYKP